MQLYPSGHFGSVLPQKNGSLPSAGSYGVHAASTAMLMKTASGAMKLRRTYDLYNVRAGRTRRGARKTSAIIGAG
jgi:hypothetical protein